MRQITNSDAMLFHSRPGAGSGELINVTPETANWSYCSLSVRRLKAGEEWSGGTGADEVALIPLGGDCTVTAAGQSWRLGGRANVFAGQPSALYLPLDTSYMVRADSPLELAIAGARAERRRQPVLITPEEVAVEIRGAGNAARQINHIIAPAFPADRLLIVEVFTPSGNWSSYPPHKHDVSDMPREADLEEIYYYRIAPDDGFAFQRLYTADGAVDAAFVIHDGDLVLVPAGYHVFAVAHGYTGYYLNVLAGNEATRTMQPADDPVYAWVRETWRDAMNDGIQSWRDIDQRLNGQAGKRAAGDA